jgi:hypothetical protein
MLRMGLSTVPTQEQAAQIRHSWADERRQFRVNLRYGVKVLPGGAHDVQALEEMKPVA